MRLLITRSASKQLLRIPSAVRSRIETKVNSLAKKPISPQAQKLTGRPGYRLRIGDYRLLYTVNQKKKEITILSIQHHKYAYKIK